MITDRINNLELIGLKKHIETQLQQPHYFNIMLVGYEDDGK